MTDAIAWALVHFLWQGAALALVAFVLMRLASSASVRYAIGVATLGAMVVAVGLTTAAARTSDVVQVSSALVVERSSSPTTQRANTSDPEETSGLARRSLGEGGDTVRALPTAWILTMWIIGVVVLSTRAMGGWWVARRVAREAITPLSDDLQAVARALTQRLGIRRAVGVFESSRVAVPVMIGWLRPVVLMPPAALSGLSIAQVEAILAHELAHVRRHDYVVNLLQTAVETALFFHPAVWWLSRTIRRERELCCDDLAVTMSDRLTYATALSALAHIQPPSLALAATDGSLRDRIRRIITNSPSSESAKGGWMAMLPLLLVVSLAAPSAFTQTVSAPPKQAPIVVQKTAPPQPKEVSVVQKPTRPRAAVVNIPVARQARAVAPESRTSPQIEQLLDEQLALERRRLELQKERLQNDAAVALRELEIAVQSGEKNLESVRKADGDESGRVKSLESSLKLAVARLETAKRALDLELMDLTLRDQELALKRRMRKAGMDTPVDRPGEVSPELKRLSLNEALLPGDIVTIVIEGATGGAREFTVDAAGSIRHPQVGDVVVAEQTTEAVREKIIKLLVAKGLATNPTVSVVVRRR